MKKNLLTLKIAVIVLGIFFSTSAKAAYTAVISGNWSSASTWGGIAPPASVSNEDITIPVGINVTLDQDLTFSGLFSSFAVNGSLSSTSNNWVMMSSGALTGNGAIGIHTITFGALSSASFSGSMNVRRIINQGLALSVSSLINVADTLELQSGSLLLATGSNLSMLTNSVIKVDGGSISSSGGILNLNNAYDAMYVGSSKTSGIELNTVMLQHLYLRMDDNSQTLTLNSNITVNGMADLSAGRLSLNGNHLTLMGDVTMAAGTSFTSNAASNLTIQGSGSMNGTLMFSNGSSIGSLTINRVSGGMVKLGSQLDIANELHLTAGTFSLESGADLVMNAGSTVRVVDGAIALNSGSFDGAAAYNVEYMGTLNTQAGVELTGDGLNNLSLNYPSGTTVLLLSDSVAVNGALNLMNGRLALNGHVMELNGTISQASSTGISGSNNMASELHLNLTSVSNDTLYFVGSGLNMLGKLKINTAGTGTLVLGSTLNIETELNMVSGKLELADDNLIIQPAASITGYNENRYVVTSEDAGGSLVMNVISGSTYVTFPVGTSNSYSPLQVQQNVAGTTGNLGVRTMNKVYSNGTSGFESSSISKVVDRTWIMNNSAGMVMDANVKLGWMTAAELNSFDRMNSYITSYGGSGWDVMTPGAAAPGANNTHELTRTGITSAYSILAVTEDGEPIGIKDIVSAGAFDLYPNPSSSVVYVALPGTGSFSYELTDISGRLIYNADSGNSHAFDVSNLDAGYYFVRVTNLENKETFVKKFIRE